MRFQSVNIPPLDQISVIMHLRSTKFAQIDWVELSLFTY